MRQFSTSPLEMFLSFWRNRELIHISAKREIIGRYRGSVLGLLWSFFNPLFMLAVYTFVFSEIFKTRWNINSDSKLEFALVLFSGLITFNMFSECINRAPTLIINNQNYVKKVIFPLEVIPYVSFISTLYHAFVSIIVWILAYTLLIGIPHPTILYLPLILTPFAFLIMGISWALASMGVFLRDVPQIVGVVTSVIMFLSPVFYPATAVPEQYRTFLYMNPLTHIIEEMHNIMYMGLPPEWGFLMLYWVITFGVACLGFFFFQKTRRGFSDVL